MSRTSAAYEAIDHEMSHIEDELHEVAKREGFVPLALTGDIWVDVNTQRVWYKVLDIAPGITSWVTPDAPELAGHGETLIAASDLDEAETYGWPAKED